MKTHFMVLSFTFTLGLDINAYASRSQGWHKNN